MNAMNGELLELQEWYASQCDGDWEHTYGITIGTLDNPGWTVEIDLTSTKLEDRTFSTVSNLEREVTWLHCSVSEGKFRGAGGVPMLGNILRVFLDWAHTGEGELAPAGG